MTPLDVILLSALLITVMGAAYLLRMAQLKVLVAHEDAETARGAMHAAQEARDDAEAAAVQAQRPVSTLSPEVSQKIRDALSTPMVRCNDCGGLHSIACPRVRRRRFRTDGMTLLEVEYWPDPWDKEHILFAEDVAE